MIKLVSESLKYDFVIFPLLILIFLTFISLISGNDFISNAFSESYTYQQSINGSVSSIDIEGTNVDFSLDPLILAIIWISIIGGVAIGSSIVVLSSGLSESGSRWLVGIIFFTSIWLMFTSLPYPLINSIGTIGYYIYFAMTIFYAIGGIWILLG